MFAVLSRAPFRRLGHNHRCQYFTM